MVAKTDNDDNSGEDEGAASENDTEDSEHVNNKPTACIDGDDDGDDFM